MTNEEIQKTMEFILSQQAQFAVNIQKLEESQTQAFDRMGRLETAFVGLFNVVNESVQAQRRMEESLTKLTNRVNDLTESLDGTKDRLDSLIVVVERYFSERQNGGATELG